MFQVPLAFNLDYPNNSIRVIDKDGIVTTILKNMVSKPSGICFDNLDNLYLADFGTQAFNLRKQ
jgi:hypothetical protein